MKNLRELLFLIEISGVGTVRINKVYVPMLEHGADIDKLVCYVKDNEKKTDEEIIRKALDRAEELYAKYNDRDDLCVITILDDIYPSKLKILGGKAPIVLFAKGDITLTEGASISIIGTRNPSQWSSEVESSFISEILDYSDRTIVSGLASGCDTIAHKECIDNEGKTIAILPCGFDKIFPVENKGLCDDIIRNGGLLLSEYPPNMEATQYTFVERDRLVAAISDALLVIECGIKSGTIHTVKFGLKLGRNVAALVPDCTAKGDFGGNDDLIRTDKVFPVSDNKSLKSFLAGIKNVIYEKEPEQLSLFK